MQFQAISDLPDSVRESMPDAEAQEVLRKAFNERADAGDTELRSWISGYRALESAGYRTNGDGKTWVQKDSPGLSDVHVNRPMGSTKPPADDDFELIDVDADGKPKVKPIAKLDKVTVDIPLFIKLLEMAREEIKTDEPLHVIAERVTALMKDKPLLTMGDYDSIAAAIKDDLKKYSPDQPRAANGEWGSGDEVYHGTNAAPFAAFDQSKIGTSTDEGKLGAGHYFSTDPNIARSHSTRIAASVDLNNPMRLKMPDWRTDKNALINRELGTKGLTGQKLTDELKGRGHDGVVLDYSPIGYHHSEVVAFEPSHIKITGSAPGGKASKNDNEPIAKRISGNSSISLNAKGEKLAAKLGDRIAAKGGLDVLHSSDLPRAIQTADAIEKAATGVNPERAKPTPALRPWRLGEIEGRQPDDVADLVKHYIEHPYEVPPGEGADGKPAESFQAAKERQLNELLELKTDAEVHPTMKIGAVMHSRGMELLQSWVDAGCPEDYNLDEKDLLHPDDPQHADVLRWHGDKVKEVDLASDDELKPGFYLILHSLTDDDTDTGNEDLEKHAPVESKQITKYLPPIEVHDAAQRAMEAGTVIENVTVPLADSTGLEEAEVRKVAEHFAGADGKAEGHYSALELQQKELICDAWGGVLAGKWAARAIKKIEKDAAVAKANEAAKDQGVMLAFWPDTELAKQLAVDGGEPADELHVTLAYFGKLSEIGMDALPALERAVEQFAATHAPVKAALGGIGRFPASPSSDGQDVAYLGVHAPDLRAFREDLVRATEAVGCEPKKDHGYNPHMTLKYTAPNAPHLLPTPEPGQVTFSKVVLSLGSARKEYQLTGQVSKADDGDHWVTINGSPVLIGADGEVKGGNPKVVAALTAPKFSEKAQRAMESRVPCKAEKQRIADEQERIISQGVGLPRTPDNAAFDLRGPKVGVEIKTMIDSKNGKVTVSGKAFARKEAEAAGPPRLKTFLVVADKRGGGTKYYIADHIGSLRVNSMTPTTIAGIRSMVR